MRVGTRWTPSEYSEGFPSSGGTCPRPKDSSHEVKQRMTALRDQSGIKTGAGAARINDPAISEPSNRASQSKTVRFCKRLNLQ